MAATSNHTSSVGGEGVYWERATHELDLRRITGRRIWGGGGLPSPAGGHLLGRPLGAGASASASCSRFRRRHDRGFRRAGARVWPISRSHHLYCGHRSPNRTCPSPLTCLCVSAVFLSITVTSPHFVSTDTFFRPFAISNDQYYFIVSFRLHRL